MDQHFEIIGAFIDGERVDAGALRAALATADGRDYLVELAAMRELVAMPEVAAPAASRQSRWSGKFLVAAAAAVVIVGAGGFALGRAELGRRSAVEQADANKAPAPTREVPAEAGVSWSSSNGSN